MLHFYSQSNGARTVCDLDLLLVQVVIVISVRREQNYVILESCQQPMPVFGRF